MPFLMRCKNSCSSSSFVNRCPQYLFCFKKQISLTTADITDLSKNDVSAINKNEKSTKSFDIVSTEGKTSTFVDGDDDVIIVSPNESIVKVMPDDEESKREQPPPTEPNESTEKNILVKTADTSSEDCGNNGKL